MGQPGRKYQGNSTSPYRYGFNGQEKSDEIAAGLTTAMFWEYDSRIAKRWNIDPVVKTWESPYLCFSGNPIIYADPNGDDANSDGGKKKKLTKNPKKHLHSELKVDMSKAPESFTTKSGRVVKTFIKNGKKYNSAWAWAQIQSQNQPGFLGAANDALIDRGLSPTVTKEITSRFKDFVSYEKQIIEIHHLDHGPTTSYGLPEKLHRGAGNTKMWHVFKKIGKSALLISTLLSVAEIANGNIDLVPGVVDVQNQNHAEMTNNFFNTAINGSFEDIKNYAESNGASKNSIGSVGIYYGTDYDFYNAASNGNYPDPSKGGPFMSGGWGSQFLNAADASNVTRTVVTHAFIYYRGPGETKYQIMGVKQIPEK